MKPMTYKGYQASIDYSDEDGCLVGRVVGIKDLITFHGTSVAQIRRAFKEALDFYLESCESRDESPDKPYSGKLMLRVPSEVHAAVARSAEISGKSINQWAAETLSQATQL